MKYLTDQIVHKFNIPKDLLVYIFSMDPQLHTNMLIINNNINKLAKRWSDYKIITEAYRTLTSVPVINQPVPLYVFMIDKSKQVILKN